MTKPDIKGFYYGWVIVGALLIILTFATGLSFYNHAVVLNALSKQSAFTVETASLAVSVFFLSGGLNGLLVAKLLDRFDPRVCITLGAICAGASLTALGYIDKTWQLFCVYILFGMGFSGSALIPATTIVTRWFRHKRAVALSIASTGLSLGGVVITPLSATLIGKMGLAYSAPILGAAYVLGIIPIAWLLLRPSPESMGLAPYKEVKPEDNDSQLNSDKNKGTSNSVSSSLEGLTLREARQQRYFWGLCFAYVFLMMAQVGGITHQYGLASVFLTESQTALVVAIIPIASIIGRLVGGWIIDRVSIRAFAISMMLIQLISLIVLATGQGVIALCVGLALFGTSVGNILMLQPLLIADAFGVREYAKIFSLSNLMSSWGTAVGPWIVGAIYNAAQQNYGTAYFAIAIAALLGLVCYLCGGKVKR